ncbi:AAA family ATPase [Candidatus Poriferisodalis sp.]|uniref:AAA family ATPase n=1 Tax=Candidatus Poriferisodalis sp. TaxID=3101277 RepID=UPI003AF7E325
MRIEGMQIDGPFKRFGSLRMSSISATTELVVMLGPNGSGKSSVFDAFLSWARDHGRAARGRISDTYFNAEATAVGRPQLKFHESEADADGTPVGRRIHLRTAHRNTPEVVTNEVQKVNKLGESNRLDRMIETDSALREHYQRIVSRFLPILSRLDGDASDDLQEIREWLAPVQEALIRVLPHLEFTNLGDPTSEGSYHFERDGIRAFRYENLSGGEKAVFDLLLDVHVAVSELASPVVCLDEPELHLNPAVQASVLSELLGLMPDGAQLWIATHSVGMIRRAFDVAAKDPGTVAFLDFGNVAGPLPEVDIEPVVPSRQLLRGALEVALDDLAGLIAPEIVVLCEGQPGSTGNAAWDQRCYRQIFRNLYQRVDFVPCGGKGQLNAASEIAAVIAPGTRVLRLRDRDDLPDDDRKRLLSQDSHLRILQRNSLESYLLDDEVLAKLVTERGDRVGTALMKLQSARDHSVTARGSAKAALGEVFQAAQTVLCDMENLGENKHQFGSGILAPLISPDMSTYQELEGILALDAVT